MEKFEFDNIDNILEILDSLFVNKQSEDLQVHQISKLFAFPVQGIHMNSMWNSQIRNVLDQGIKRKFCGHYDDCLKQC